jgi:WD40 repeat protein
MPDVFLSYAREDDAIVERLRTALIARDREVWLDRSTELGEGIVPASDWNASALDGIDRSDGFVFVLSPSSLASRPCRDELAYAVAGNKRLLPVCVADPPDPPVAGHEVPEPLRSLSWIMLRPGTDDFEAGVDALIRALDTDIDVVREHTRILVRAKAWELAQRRTSPLLRGEELRAAELWLPRAAAAGAPPTEVQRDFIIASRRTANRRQRIAVVGSLTVTAVAIALSVFALIQRSQARHQAKLANSRALAASAQASLGTDPEQSIALAAHGVRTSPTPEAVNALAVALQASRLRAVLNGSSAVDAVAFSPDGRELAVGYDDGAVGMWRLADRGLLWIQGRGDPAAESLSFTAQGDRLVVGRGTTGTVAHGCSTDVLNAANGHIEQPLDVATTGICSQYVAVVGATREVAVSTDTGLVGLWNVDTGRSIGPRVQEIGGSLQVASGITAAPNGKQLAVTGVHVVALVNLAPGPALPSGGPSGVIDSCWCGATPQAAVAYGLFNPTASAFSPDGRQLFVADEYQSSIFDLGYDVATQLYAQNNVTVAAAWAADGRIVAGAASYLGVDVWSSSSRLVELLHGNAGSKFLAVALTADGTLAGGASDGSVRVWAADPDLWNASVATPTNDYLSDAGVAPGVGLTAVGDAQTGVLLIDHDGRLGSTLHPHGDEDAGFAVGADGVLAFARAGRIEVWRLPSGAAIHSWPLPAGAHRAAPTAVAVSANGQAAAALYDDGRVARFGPRGEVSTMIPGISATTLTALSMSPDGRLLAVTAGSTVRILDARLATVRRFDGDAADFAPTGTLLAVQTPSNAIDIVRTGDWSTQAVVHGDTAPGTNSPQLTFSPGGALLATVGGDGVLRVWDAADGALLVTRQLVESAHRVQQLGIPVVALTADGDAVVADGPDDAIRTYDVCDKCLDPHALLAQADARLAEITPVPEQAQTDR